jgi:hypothetical protein
MAMSDKRVSDMSDDEVRVLAGAAPDGKMATALDEIRADLNDGAAYPRRVMEIHVPRLLTALDEALKLHQPRQLHDMVESYDGRHLCAHSPDYDGDRHYEGDDGLWYCKDRPTVMVCTSCSDGADGDLWAAWPCPTYGAVSRAVLGEDGSDGGS